MFTTTTTTTITITIIIIIIIISICLGKHHLWTMSIDPYIHELGSKEGKQSASCLAALPL
jgi:hypothetical protein